MDFWADCTARSHLYLSREGRKWKVFIQNTYREPPFVLDANVSSLYVFCISNSALDQSLGEHRIRYLHESADVRSLHIVHRTILFCAIFHAGFMNAFHDPVEPAVNLLT